jgi:hypothetical protein
VEHNVINVYKLNIGCFKTTFIYIYYIMFHILKPYQENCITAAATALQRKILLNEKVD